MITNIMKLDLIVEYRYTHVKTSNVLLYCKLQKSKQKMMSVKLQKKGQKLCHQKLCKGFDFVFKRKVDSIVPCKDFMKNVHLSKLPSLT